MFFCFYIFSVFSFFVAYVIFVFKVEAAEESTIVGNPLLKSSSTRFQHRRHNSHLNSAAACLLLPSISAISPSCRPCCRGCKFYSLPFAWSHNYTSYMFWNMCFLWQILRKLVTTTYKVDMMIKQH